MKVYKEWLVDDNNNIIKMPLREWFEYFKISPVLATFDTIEGISKTYELWQSGWKKERNGYIDIYKCGGYGLRHDEAEQYANELFYAGNADFDVKLVQVRI